MHFCDLFLNFLIGLLFLFLMGLFPIWTPFLNIFQNLEIWVFSKLYRFFLVPFLLLLHIFENLFLLSKIFFKIILGNTLAISKNKFFRDGIANHECNNRFLDVSIVFPKDISKADVLHFNSIFGHLRFPSKEEPLTVEGIYHEDAIAKPETYQDPCFGKTCEAELKNVLNHLFSNIIKIAAYYCVDLSSPRIDKKSVEEAERQTGEK